MFHNAFTRKIRDDEQSKNIIYEMFYSQVYKTAYFITRDPHTSQDVLQETFIKVFRNMDKIDDSAKVKSWISTIASRTAIDFLRKQKRGNECQFENVNDIKIKANELNFTVEDEVENSFINEMVRNEIESLAPNHRRIIYLKYISDLKDQEIANILHLKVATVKTRLHRAKSQLKKKLKTKESYIIV